MAAYSKASGDSLLDVALDVIAEGRPVQLRVAKVNGEVEIVTGRLERAYRRTREGALPDTVHAFVSGLNIGIPEDADWVMVVDEPAQNERGMLIIPPQMTMSEGYPPLSSDDPLYGDRYLPVTEEQWTEEHRGYEGGDLYEVARPVIVEWHDPAETPTGRIRRLNHEVIEQSQLANRIQYRPRQSTELRVIALRWKDGNPTAWEEVTVLRKLSSDAALVRFDDGTEQGAPFSEIRATVAGHERLRSTPFTH